MESNLLEEKWVDFDEAWAWLAHHSIKYDWEYRRKICTKCPLETQQKLSCHRVDEFKTINGMKIQKTYCSKLKNARANKFRNHINHVIHMHPMLPKVAMD